MGNRENSGLTAGFRQRCSPGLPLYYGDQAGSTRTPRAIVCMRRLKFPWRRRHLFFPKHAAPTASSKDPTRRMVNGPERTTDRTLCCISGGANCIARSAGHTTLCAPALTARALAAVGAAAALPASRAAISAAPVPAGGCIA